MKKIVLLLCIVLMASCCSCGFFTPEYVCEVDSVNSIQIVNLGEFNSEENRFEYEVLAEISDYQAFANQINETDRSVNWGDPVPMKSQSIVIKINYSNGDFDLLHWDAQLFYHSETEYYGTGYYFFDKEQFDALISDYINE